MTIASVFCLSVVWWAVAHFLSYVVFGPSKLNAVRQSFSLVFNFKRVVSSIRKKKLKEKTPLDSDNEKNLRKIVPTLTLKHGYFFFISAFQISYSFLQWPI